MQWVLLWYIYSKFSLQTKDVDRELPWMVIFFHLASVTLSFSISLLVSYKKKRTHMELFSTCTLHFVRRFLSFGYAIPYRPVEDLAFSVARFFETGGTFQNYYMVSHLIFNRVKYYSSWLIKLINCSILEEPILDEQLVDLWLQQVMTMMLQSMNMVSFLSSM